MSAYCDDQRTKSVSATRVVGSQGQRPREESLMIERIDSPNAHIVPKSPTNSVRRNVPWDATTLPQNLKNGIYIARSSLLKRLLV
jgi:hypothetical protein